MNEEAGPQQAAVVWSPEARADLRSIDRDTALRLLKTLDRLLKTGTGNVKQLEGFSPPLFRLRIGAWRLIYRKLGNDAIEASAVATARMLTARVYCPAAATIVERLAK